jgi:hypothetical protein
LQAVGDGGAGLEPNPDHNGSVGIGACKRGIANVSALGRSSVNMSSIIR